MLSLEIKKNLKKDGSHLKITWHSKRQKKNIENREGKTENEKKSNNNNSFLLLLFYGEKFIFSQKTYLEKLIRNTVIKHQRPHRYALVLYTPYFDPKYLAID